MYAGLMSETNISLTQGLNNIYQTSIALKYILRLLQGFVLRNCPEVNFNVFIQGPRHFIASLEAACHSNFCINIETSIGLNPFQL